MASPGSKFVLPADIPAEVLDVLNRARATGNLDAVVSEMLTPPQEFELVSHGSMTDGSKRRLVEVTGDSVIPPEDLAGRLVEEADRSAYGHHQAPIAPSKKDSPASFGKKLPEGVKDLQMWGRTVLEHGKFERSSLSYSEFLASDKTEHRDYVKYVRSLINRTDLTPAMKDFVRYVNVMTNQGASSSVCYDGSSVIRRLK